MIQLAGSTDHINKLSGARNVGVMVVMSGVQLSGSYQANLFGTSSTCDVPVDKNIAVALSVVYTSLCYLSEQNNSRMSNGSTHK